MTKERSTRKKLKLKKRVLVDLTDEQMGEVAGGHDPTCPPTHCATCCATCGNNHTCVPTCD